MLSNTLFGTSPAVIHAQGPHEPKPLFEEICELFFASPPQALGAHPGVTILTWNNGHPGMGLFERSLDHLGIPCLVLGQGVHPWVNSRHKPLLTAEALEKIDTEYVMGVDSRDAILTASPDRIVRELESEFACSLVFSADRMNWPNLKRFRTFEDALPGARQSDFRYLNSGAFIGKVDFCREFFRRAAHTAPAPEAPEADQGIFKQVFQEFHPSVQLDYRCAIFQNLGFVAKPILTWRGAELSRYVAGGAK